LRLVFQVFPVSERFCHIHTHCQHVTKPINDWLLD
jgi:hypothetical protein